MVTDLEETYRNGHINGHQTAHWDLYSVIFWVFLGTGKGEQEVHRRIPRASQIRRILVTTFFLCSFIRVSIVFVRSFVFDLNG